MLFHACFFAAAFALFSLRLHDATPFFRYCACHAMGGMPLFSRHAPRHCRCLAAIGHWLSFDFHAYVIRLPLLMAIVAVFMPFCCCHFAAACFRRSPAMPCERRHC